MKTPVEILCEWAWSKVNLKDLQALVLVDPSEENKNKIQPAIVSYRSANRLKKELDKAYQWHHELLYEFTSEAVEKKLTQGVLF